MNKSKGIIVAAIVIVTAMSLLFGSNGIIAQEHDHDEEHGHEEDHAHDEHHDHDEHGTAKVTEAVFIPTIASVIIVSLLSLIGAITLGLKKSLLNKMLFILVALGAGTLIGGALFDLIPEAIELGGNVAFQYIVVGIIVFFLIERLIHLRHHHHVIEHEHEHDNNKQVKPFAYLNLIGEAIHNFLDGTIIAAAYLIGFEFGVIATIAIILHEIPQEIADFGILVHGGMSVKKALSFNFIIALFAVAGALSMFLLASVIPGLSLIMISIAGGAFLYIALGTLLPELHHETSAKKIFIQVLFLVIGVLLLYWLGITFEAAHVHV